MQIDLRAAGTSGRAPVVANRERTVEPIGHRATGQRAQHVVRAERNARHGCHHFGRRAVLDDAPVTRQEKRAVVRRRHEREQRGAEGRHRLEANGLIGKAADQPGANAPAVDRSADANLGGQGLDALTTGESLKESRRDVRCERAGPGGQLGQLGGARRRADRQKQNGTKAPTHAHFLLSFCFAVRILRSISARSMESPSPASARVNATIASSRRPSFSSTSP